MENKTPTPSTPGNRPQFVQYTPQVVNYSNNRLPSPHEHFEDSMLELKDDDQLPSNYSFVAHQQPHLQPPPQSIHQPQQMVMMVGNQFPPQQQVYIPSSEQQARVYDQPSNSNYINNGGPINPNVIQSLNELPSANNSKYITWTRVVMIFAILLVIYSCLGIFAQILMLFSGSIIEQAGQVSIGSIVGQMIIQTISLACGVVGIWSTVTKNVKHRKYATISHLALLSLVIIGHAVQIIVVNIEQRKTMTELYPAFSNQSMIIVIVISVLLSVGVIFACCGSCLGCQAYRYKLITKLEDNQTSQSGEEFMVMRDEV